MNCFYQFYETTFKEVMCGKYEEEIPQTLPVGLIVDATAFSEIANTQCPECGHRSLFVDEIRIAPQWDSAEEFSEMLTKGKLIIGGNYRITCDHGICIFQEEGHIAVERFRDKVPTHLLQKIDMTKTNYSSVIIERELDEEESIELKKRCEEMGSEPPPNPLGLLN